MSRALLLVLALTLCGAARAQQDMPIPYSDEQQGFPAQPIPQSPGAGPPDRGRHYAPEDDPATGLGGQAVVGLLLLDSSRGGGVEPLLALGVRMDWDYGRKLVDPVLHQALFLDVTAVGGLLRDGTPAVSATTTFYDFTLAPAYEIPFGDGSPFGVYFQVGGGVALVASSVTASATRRFQQLEPLIQYGAGLRGRPLLSEDSLLRLTFRLEVTRFRRAYMDDTLILGSLGLAF